MDEINPAVMKYTVSYPLCKTNRSLSAGFNVETVEYKNISFTVWDVGGQDKVGILLLIGEFIQHCI